MLSPPTSEVERYTHGRRQIRAYIGINDLAINALEARIFTQVPESYYDLDRIIVKGSVVDELKRSYSSLNFLRIDNSGSIAEA